MDLLDKAMYVLFTFPDGTHLVVHTTLNTNLAPKMEPGCLYDLTNKRNIPLEELEEATKEIFEEYPEEYREESEFYGQFRYGI